MASLRAPWHKPLRLDSDSPTVHGTRASYQYYGCRCEPCRAAQARSLRAWRDRHPNACVRVEPEPTVDLPLETFLEDQVTRIQRTLREAETRVRNAYVTAVLEDDVSEDDLEVRK